MHGFFRSFMRIAAIGVSASAALAHPAHALMIVPSFDSSIISQGNAAALEAAISTGASTIDGLYSNPGTVNIYFEFNSGVLGQSLNGENFVPYAQYVSQLSANSAANPGNTVLATAVANIAHGNTGDWVLGTTAFLRVGMGFTGSGVTPCFDSTGNFVPTCNSVYDAVISVGSVSTAPAGPGQNSQALAVVEHEMNEVLGGGGPGSTIGENLSAFVTGPVIGPTDPYRYHASGPNCASVTTTPSFTTSNAEIACYSYDGGHTALVQMNQVGGNSDYGDFSTTSPNIPYIQDAFDPGPTPQYTSASPEFKMLESIGYNATLASVPEPSTVALLAGAIGGLGWLRRRRDVQR